MTDHGDVNHRMGEKWQRAPDIDEEEFDKQEEPIIVNRDYLRDDILETVDECLGAWERGRVQYAASTDPQHRCVVCTLPYGSCQHSQQWIETRCQQPLLEELPKDSVELAMDDIADVLTPFPSLPQTTSASDRSQLSSTLQWATIPPRPVDMLSGKIIDLSSPSSRVGHTLVRLGGRGCLDGDTDLIVMFGGVSTACCHSRRIDSTMIMAMKDDFCSLGIDDTTQQVLSYHSDVRVFRVGRNTWHRPTMSGDLPDGRYGHVSLALDQTMMWMCGGRLESGHEECDVYILDIGTMKWERIKLIHGREPSPRSRAWSAAARVGDMVVLFGGIDPQTGEIFNDVWTWDVTTRRWADQIVVGIPPLARYGHALLLCPNEHLLILGGCCVSTKAEGGLPADHDEMQQKLHDATTRVVRACELEEAELTVAAITNYSTFGIPSHSRNVSAGPSTSEDVHRRQDVFTRAKLKEIARSQARLAAAVARREKDTRALQEELRLVLLEKESSAYWARLQSKNPLQEIDANFLDVENMIWKPCLSTISGASGNQAPAARMNFSAVVIGPKVIMWGGCSPTSKRIKLVEDGVNIFDMVHHVWSRPLAQQHTEGIQLRVDAARRQLRRAERTLFDATQRALSLGAPGGRTLQVIQAEAVVAVNQWKVRVVEDEMRSARTSPRPRAAHSGCAVGHRVLYFGGWGAGEAVGEILVLDVEQPNEKERRLGEEFHQQLERERQEREKAEVEELRRRAMQEKMRNELERSHEAAETVIMVAEDARSAIPELTIAPTPRLRYASSTTLWLEWDQPSVDSMGCPLHDRVEYILYMRGGFREWEEGDRVLVEYVGRAQRKAALPVVKCSGSSTITSTRPFGGDTLDGLGDSGTSSTDMKESTMDDGGEDNFSDIPITVPSENQDEYGDASQSLVQQGTLLPAAITSPNTRSDFFDIRWDNGERELNVHRSRIHRIISPVPSWTMVYEGEETTHAVQGMVPAAVIELEKVFPFEVCVEFSLQTRGTEVPREKLSRHSPVVAFRTASARYKPVDDRSTHTQSKAITAKDRLPHPKGFHQPTPTIGFSNKSLSSGTSQSSYIRGHLTGNGQGKWYL